MVSKPISSLFFALGLCFFGCGKQAADPLQGAGIALEALRPVPDLAAGRVAWRSWSGRDSARALSRPIFLFLYTRRSYWCRRMAARCFEDPDLAGELSRHSFPIRVDADRRPDLAERFGMGGWPSVVFLTPEGEWITGTTYMDAVDLQRLLRRVRVYIDVPERREDLERQRARLKALQVPPPRPVAPSPALLQRLADSTRAAIARGENPGSEAFLMLLDYGRLAGDTAAEQDALAGLDHLASSRLRDRDGAFFLAPLTPDAALIDREKHLALNAGLLAAFSRAARQTGRAACREAAVGLGRALLKWFYSPQESLFFAGLTGFAATADEAQEHVALLAEGMAPFRDPAVFAGWNGLAVSALLELDRAVPDRGYGAAGRRVMDALRHRFRMREGGVEHFPGAPAGMPLLLEDQALVARAALDLFAAEGRAEDLRFARDLAGMMLRRFGRSSGALRDRTPEPDGALSPAVDRFLPSGNGVAAQVFHRLYALDGRADYRAASEGILKALVGPNIDRAAYLGALGRGLTAYLYGERTVTPAVTPADR